jgi:lipid A ethanolaminephosphotransferase
LLYTDHVLGRLIDLLQAREPQLDTAMLYVSDHGESLGESGLYLHGVPYPIAPDVQKHVPMVAWISPGFARSAGLDVGCLRAKAGQPVSHDNLFHSVLGVLDVQTQAYDATMDVFAPCRRR